MIRVISYFISSCLLVAVFSCNRSQSNQKEKTSFTKVDSLTETYLLIQDSLLHTWNVMVWDEKEKIEAMHDILHLMHKQSNFDDHQLISLEQRLEQLNRIRFTQKSLANPYVIEEYDFASNSLVSEIISLAEADENFIKNEKASKLVDKVKMAEQRVNRYRDEYDNVAQRYNLFLEMHEKYLRDIDKDHSGEKRALFQMASE